MNLSRRVGVLLSGCALALALAVGPGSGAAGESDHERARQALEAGKVLPLGAVLDIVEREFPGQVVKVEFEEEDDEFIYEIRVLQSGGGILKLEIDARDGTVISAKGRDIKFKSRD
ncbi:PepSY domain-containing protein [Achromobacter arsenitoxydans]|uniref:Peptidase propeptide and ypeb domain-containing protein n=1 Tax=Achromobacter arsenitoxydans SY8 TaxID=477184 RepID=H0FDZ4_9BURK|nr:PepSY domain-containing protein [Achromobacter arsenitoxydans]EHK63516.1 peptidase propeptide and ypeb domain-containing protein [Achromobacter arsenitoxydans SY8]